MKPKRGFDAAIERANHLLKLYELICDTRKRNVRSDWASSFKTLMHWPAGETIVRVDGKGKQSVLVFREACNIDREHLAHSYLSELLRNAVVASVSALDRFLHDLIVKHSWKLLSQKEQDIPRDLMNFELSALDARKALEQLRKNSKARPGNLIKTAIQRKLHRNHTFQSADSVVRATKLLGVQNFWGKVAKEMPSRPTAEEAKATLEAITKRRNQIVHEADLVVTSRHQPRLRAMTYAEARERVEWMGQFGTAVDSVVAKSIK